MKKYKKLLAVGLTCAFIASCSSDDKKTGATTTTTNGDVTLSNSIPLSVNNQWSYEVTAVDSLTVPVSSIVTKEYDKIVSGSGTSAYTMKSYTQAGDTPSASDVESGSASFAKSGVKLLFSTVYDIDKAHDLNLTVKDGIFSNETAAVGELLDSQTSVKDMAKDHLVQNSFDGDITPKITIISKNYLDSKLSTLNVKGTDYAKIAKTRLDVKVNVDSYIKGTFTIQGQTAYIDETVGVIKGDQQMGTVNVYMANNIGVVKRVVTLNTTKLSFSEITLHPKNATGGTFLAGGVLPITSYKLGKQEQTAMEKQVRSELNTNRVTTHLLTSKSIKAQ